MDVGIRLHLRIVEASLEKGGLGATNLNRLGGANESNGHSKKEGKQETNERLHCQSIEE